MTQITLPDVSLAPPRVATQANTTTAARGLEFERSLPGMRGGWAMRSVYFLSDVFAFALSLVTANGLVDLARGLEVAGAQIVELKLYLLWGIGLVAVAAVQQTY